jgi:DNA (cytosine-5)-methyltransferase 1
VRTFGSLFAGIGGFDLGFERAGLKCAWQVEISPFCNKILAKHWPEVKRWGDIKSFTGDGFDQVDVICGGFPCKQTSTAAAITGNRNGLKGADSGLWYEYLRIVRLLGPSWVIVENTAGSATWAAEIEGGLEGLGYSVQRLDAEARDFGAPHRRRRVFWIANAHGKRLEITRPIRSPQTGSKQGRTAHGNPWLSSLAGIGRVDDGLPGGVDRRFRIEACGNAVVPAMAQWIGEALIREMQ